MSRDVRYWHLADIPSCAAHVRFRIKADIANLFAAIPLRLVAIR